MKTKKIASLALAAAMVFSGFTTAFAANKTLKLEAEKVTVQDFEEGQEVEVKVNATENMGYANGSVFVSWEKSALELTGVTFNKENAPNDGSPPINETVNQKGQYKITFGDILGFDHDDDDNTPGIDFTGKGLFFTLKFKVANGATAGTYPITIEGESGSFVPVDMFDDTVNFTGVAGSVTLVAAAQKYAVEVKNDGNGTATASPASAAAGVTVRINPNPKAGFEFDKITVTDGDGNNVTVNADGKSFAMPESKATVNVAFKALPKYKVTVNAGTGGTATSSVAEAVKGTIVRINAIPNEGYVLQGITAQDTAGPITINNNNSFTIREADVTVDVTFRKKVAYAIELSVGENGEATTNPDGTAIEGDTVTVIATADKGYKVDTITVNGKAISGTTFTMPSSIANVDVTFRKTSSSSGGGGGSSFNAKPADGSKYTLTYNTNGGSSVSSEKYNPGAKVTLTKTPTREGYVFTGWYTDSDLKNKVTSVEMTGAMTLYAGWQEEGAAPVVDPAPVGETPLIVVTINSASYNLNGQTMTMDSAPFIDGNNRTMLPVRVVANALGISNANINWDKDTKTASFTREDGVVVSCTVGSNVIKVGDEDVTIDTVPVIQNDRIYLPMRALFNAFNVPNENILWDAAARTVTVTKKA